MRPPAGVPSRSNWISMYLPKRELLSLRSVLALPNAVRGAGVSEEEGEGAPGGRRTLEERVGLE